MSINFGTAPYREEPLDLDGRLKHPKDLARTVGEVEDYDPTDWPYTVMGSGVLQTMAENLAEEPANQPVAVSLPMVQSYTDDWPDMRAVVFSQIEADRTLFGCPYHLGDYLQRKDVEPSPEVLKS